MFAFDTGPLGISVFGIAAAAENYFFALSFLIQFGGGHPIYDRDYFAAAFGALTVLLTTHYMEEAASADYIVIIDHGCIAAEGTPYELKSEYVKDYLSIYGVTREEVESLGMVYEEIRDGYRIAVETPLAATGLIVNHASVFRDYEIVKGGMDDVFITVTGKKLGGEQ